MKFAVYDRDDTALSAPLDLDYDIERYSKAAIGGPKQANINIKGNDRELWRLISELRKPVRIYSDKGDSVWHGIISDVDATVLSPDRPDLGRVHVGISLRDMHNSIALAYALVDLTDFTKSRDTTAYFTDQISIDEYGTKQLLWSPGAASEAHANAAGTAHLYQSRYPRPIITPARDVTESGAVMTCVGRWETMAWKYYANSGTLIYDTAELAGSIIATSGQFFGTTWQDTNSGISLTENRDGDNTALYYVTQLLETGTTNFRRMLVDVDFFGNVRIYEEPDVPAYPHRLFSDGSFEDPYGNPLRNETCPVAFWARRADIVSASVNSSAVADPSLVFAEEMEYIVAEDKLVHRARGDPDPFEFPVVNYG